MQLMISATPLINSPSVTGHITRCKELLARWFATLARALSRSTCFCGNNRTNELSQGCLARNVRFQMFIDR